MKTQDIAKYGPFPAFKDAKGALFLTIEEAIESDLIWQSYTQLENSGWQGGNTELIIRTTLKVAKDYYEQTMDNKGTSELTL